MELNTSYDGKDEEEGEYYEEEEEYYSEEEEEQEQEGGECEEVDDKEKLDESIMLSQLEDYRIVTLKELYDNNVVDLASILNDNSNAPTFEKLWSKWCNSRHNKLLNFNNVFKSAQYKNCFVIKSITRMNKELPVFDFDYIAILKAIFDAYFARTGFGLDRDAIIQLGGFDFKLVEIDYSQKITKNYKKAEGSEYIVLMTFDPGFAFNELIPLWVNKYGMNIALYYFEELAESLFSVIEGYIEDWKKQYRLETTRDSFEEWFRTQCYTLESKYIESIIGKILVTKIGNDPAEYDPNESNEIEYEYDEYDEFNE